MKNKPFSITLLLGIILSSGCSTSNTTLQSKFQQEFEDSIFNAGAVKYKYLYDPLTPQASYLVGSKIQFLQFRMNPEVGFSEAYIFFDSEKDSIEKYILRIAQPNWEDYSNSYDDTFHDTIYEIYPKLKLTIAHSDGHHIDSIFRENIIEHYIKFIYEMKRSTENKYLKEKQESSF